MTAFLKSLEESEAKRIKTVSVLRNMQELKPERIDGIVNTSMALLARAALADLQGSVIIRDLLPSDLPGYSTNLYTETSGTAIDWATTTGGDDTQIADDTTIAIWGVRLMTPATSETAATAFQDLTPPITALRISVGSSKVALWNLYQIMSVHVDDLSGDAAHNPMGGIVESPIIITKRQKLKIEGYSATTAADPYNYHFFGAVAEKAGLNISPPE